MKKISSSKLLLIFSTIGLLVYSAIYACSDNGDWGWNYDSNFTPEAFVDKSYSPLFLSSDFFYGIGFDTEHNTRFNDEIVNDWATYLKGIVDKEYVSYFLIDSSVIDVKNIYVFSATKKHNFSTIKWSKKINLKDKKFKNFIEFLYNAQALETVSVTTDYWSYEPQKTVYFSDFKRVKNIERKYNETIDPFLKNRYWFLTVKANFYSDNAPNANLFFQKTEITVPKNTLYYRAICYLAGLEYRNKNYAKSNYQYAQVFDKCPKLRVVAAYSFRPQDQTDWNQSLTMAKTNNEKAALWAIHGYYADEHNAIQKIYELNPQSEHLDYLLMRLINKVEITMNKSSNEQNSQNKDIVNDTSNARAINLVLAIAKANNTLRPHLWNIAAAYMETVNGNFAEADKNFSIAKSKMPNTAIAIKQLRLLQFINNLSKLDQINSSNVKTILADLNWLYFELPKDKLDNFRYQNATSWSKSYVSKLFQAHNNSVMAELFNRDNNFYNTEKNVIAMKSFLLKENKSDVETIASKIYNVNVVDINQYQAVKATFQNKIAEAIIFVKQTDSLQYNNLLGNPFNGRIKDCHDCEHEEFQKKKYSQLEFLTTIKVMQDKIEKQEDVYINALLLGNAFYNITHFGNARLFYESNIIGYGSTLYDFDAKTKAMITNCSLAQMYYQKAFDAAVNQEQKAKCEYMLAKCERNEYYNKKYNTTIYVWGIEENRINFLAWNGFKNLKNNYSSTKFYQEVIAECGYFNTFVTQQ